MKAAALVLLSACAALLVRRTNPELGLALSVAAVCVVLLLSLTILGALSTLRDTARRVYGVSEVYLLPVIKCCAAAILARLSADLCREASQNAAASAMELLGVLCALASAMPLLTSMLSVIGELL